VAAGIAQAEGRNCGCAANGIRGASGARRGGFRSAITHYHEDRRLFGGYPARSFKNFRSQSKDISPADAAGDAQHRSQRSWSLFAWNARTGRCGHTRTAAGNGRGILRSGGEARPGAQVVLLLAHIEKAEPDELGGLMVQATEGSILSDLGLATALGVVITDKETQMPAGMLIVGHAEDHKWRPNEAYFLQAIGDQMLMSVSHTRLRSLVRRMGVSDERSGLLSRSSYQSCLLTEADRARTQGTPLALTILQIDHGAEILRQQGESPLERFLEQLARSLQPIVRQNDVPVKYTSWSLAFILPDTTLAGAQNLADKLRRAASGLRPPWDSTQITLSAGIVEAVPKPDYDSEDIVTDLINRAEFSIEEARKRGGDTVVALETPKL